MIFVEEFTALSWRCVRFVPETASWPDEVLLQAHGLRVVELDGQTVGTKRDLFEGLSDAFSFPDYFGFNWDAVDECLRDLEWVPAKGHVLRVRGGTDLWQQSPALAGALVETWLSAAESWAHESVPFVLVFMMRRAST